MDPNQLLVQPQPYMMGMGGCKKNPLFPLLPILFLVSSYHPADLWACDRSKQMAEWEAVSVSERSGTV